MKAVRETELALRGVRCEARVGCSQEERADAREVIFDVVLRFSRPPEACETDALPDTVCYAEISRSLQSLCRENEFALLEKMGADAFNLIRRRLPDDVRLAVRVTKEKPPLPGVDAASFRLSEWAT